MACNTTCSINYIYIPILCIFLTFYSKYDVGKYNVFCFQVNFFVGAFYDGVQLLGMALNETLTMGGDIKDGKAITKLMWNRSFHGKSSQRTDNFYFICRSCRCLNENLYCNLSYFNVFSPLFTFYKCGYIKTGVQIFIPAYDPHFFPLMLPNISSY